jgi:hypothetical protein
VSRWPRSLAAACAILALAAPAARAHGGNADYRSVIEGVTPSVPGVEIEVRNYDSELELRSSDHRVTIYGYEGEPYARVLANGAVQVNERSPATYLNEDRYGATKVPALADPDAPPRWKVVDESGTLVWHDHRMHYMGSGTAPQVTDESRKTKVFDYRVPIAIDGREGAIAGTLFWVGPADTSKTPFVIAGAVIVVLGGAAVLVVRRRRGAGGGEHENPGKEAW